MGLRVLVGRRRGVEQVAALEGSRRELADRRLDAEMAPQRVSSAMEAAG